MSATKYTAQQLTHASNHGIVCYATGTVIAKSLKVLASKITDGHVTPAKSACGFRWARDVAPPKTADCASMEPADWRKRSRDFNSVVLQAWGVDKAVIKRKAQSVDWIAVSDPKARTPETTMSQAMAEASPLDSVLGATGAPVPVQPDPVKPAPVPSQAEPETVTPDPAVPSQAKPAPAPVDPDQLSSLASSLAVLASFGIEAVATVTVTVGDKVQSFPVPADKVADVVKSLA